MDHPSDRLGRWACNCFQERQMYQHAICFFKSLCAFQRPTHHQYNNKPVYLCTNREGIISRTSELPSIIFFPGVWRRCTLEDARYIVTPQRTELKRDFCMFELPESFLNMLCFFQPDNDLFLSSTVSYLAYLLKLERKYNHLMWRMLLSLANAALSLIIIPII